MATTPSAMAGRPYVVFSRHACQWCRAAEAALRALDCAVYAVELDGRPDAEARLQQLFEARGVPLARRNTVPQVFAGDDADVGEWIGGFENLVRHIAAVAGGGGAYGGAYGARRLAAQTARTVSASASKPLVLLRRAAAAGGGADGASGGGCGRADCVSCNGCSAGCGVVRRRSTTPSLMTDECGGCCPTAPCYCAATSSTRRVYAPTTEVRYVYC